MEFAPETEEGAALWRILRQMNAWSGGGMTMLKVDRSEIFRRTGVPEWIADPLLDAFEASGSAARKIAQDRKPKERN